MSVSPLPEDPGRTPFDPADLLRQVRALEARVAALERRIEGSAAEPAPTYSFYPPTPALEMPVNPLPLLGRALLALAGAYVLRALTDSGVLPPLAGVATGLVYSFAALLLAARIPVERRFATALTVSTSMAIMAPLLWEASGRLKVLNTWAAAIILTLFVSAALILAWRRGRTLISGLVATVALLLAAALLLATYDLLPFTLAILAIAAAIEFAECNSHSTGVRWAAALLANAAVLLFSYVMARAGGLPEGYVPTPPAGALAAQLILVVIYAAGAIAQSIFRGRALALVEIFQTALALVTGLGGMVWVFHARPTVLLALGVAALSGGLASYAVSFLLFDRENKTNFRAWSSFGLVLVLAGTFLPFSGSSFWALWCVCAVVCCWVALARRLPTLGLHGAIYLLLGAALSRAAGQSLLQLFGAASSPFSWTAALVVLAASAASWAAIELSPPAPSAPWRKVAASLAIAASFALVFAGAAIHALVSAWRTAPRATLGTAVLTTLSVALAWVSARWRKREGGWLVYGLMAIGAYKLVMRDFPEERNLTLVVSLLFYGGALILLPRLLQRARAAEAAGTRPF